MPKRKTTVLVADDDLQLLDLVTLNLELEGYGVLRASDGRQALERIERHHPDLVLLDVMMPRMSGFAVCHRVRACSTVPIIIITARGQEQDKIRGLDLGADDYLVKPFSVGELLARVRAVLRRAQFTTGELAPTGQSPTILGALSIDYAQRKVAMAGRKVVLTATEYRLLAYLAHNADRIVPQEQLLEHAWGSAYVGEDHLLQVNINRLRRKLEPDPAHPRYLLTEAGVGYVLATPPQAQAGPEPAEGREPMMDAERHRLGEAEAHHQPWYRWGPYLAERQWGTVREDYSPSGTAWDSFPHDHARSRAYRWGEDGLLGICDDQGFLCFALALWNEADPILKERFFGLTGTEGNHGEDVKEYYFFLDSTPTHSYMKALYKYPQRAFPYAELVAENRRRGRSEPEYELLDTGVFTGNRYFDVTVEYAKVGPEDILIRMTATNRGPGAAPLHLLPTLWFRNTWAWGYDHRRPELRAIREEGAIHQAPRLVRAAHQTLGEYWLMCERVEEMPALLFTENESNAERLWEVPSRTPCVKDGINDAVVHGARGTVNPKGVGTRVAAHYRFLVAAGATQAVLLRLSAQRHSAPFVGAAELFTQRREEADHFYQSFGHAWMSEDARSVQRQAFAGLLWSKQFYYYDVAQWLDGDPAGPPPPPERHGGRNAEWRHLNNADVLSMPDTWEFPWYAAWDLACHCIPLALVDPSFAKRQLILLLREWYMHPNGQLPAYEWGFGDVNPPVHAWAAWRVYKIEQRATGKADRAFLERVFHKLLLNFTWWVNRKDRDGRNVFQGGFLGLDNIGVFDRGAPLPTGGHLEQSDGTAWMGMYCLTMLTIALELSRENRVYEDVATKFFEHFLYIAGALNDIGSAGIALWDEEDEFFYDVLHLPDGEVRPLKIRSLVGIVPLLAVETIEPDLLETLPEFRARLEWFLANRPGLSSLVSRWYEPGMGERRLLALVRGHRMKRLLKRLLDPEEFLGDHGIRSISKYRAHHPFVYQVNGRQYTVRYEPAESESGVFGGNSNWRGPIWFPINYLLIEALQKFHHYYGDDFLVECPTGSGTMLTLWQIAEELSCRLTHIFLRDPHGRRPVFGSNEVFQTDPDFRDYLLFHEYFHGETGAGLGASHQTGWTALVAKLLEQTGGR